MSECGVGVHRRHERVLTFLGRELAVPIKAILVELACAIWLVVATLQDDFAGIGIDRELRTKSGAVWRFDKRDCGTACVNAPHVRIRGPPTLEPLHGVIFSHHHLDGVCG